jgi:hypothetical protein
MYSSFTKEITPAAAIFTASTPRAGQPSGQQYIVRYIAGFDAAMECETLVFLPLLATQAGR